MASLTDPAQQDRRPSPGLSINLPSNNPFRNPRTASPGISPQIRSPASLPGLSPRVSSPQLAQTNPFLAAHEQSLQQPVQTETSPFAMAPEPAQTQPQRLIDTEASQLFHRLTLADNGAPKGAPPTKAPMRPTNVDGSTTSNHKPSRSDEAERRRDPRARPRPRPDVEKKELDIFASPEKQRRPRRNSESSIMSKTSLSEEERKRRERRRREMEGRRSSKERDSSKPRSSRRRPRGMDLIDQLDQTGIYGSGYIHHDGPFDAVNPHRNRRRDDRAPMRAFPVGSANMVMGGSGPINKNVDVDRIHGITPQGFNDYATAPVIDNKPKALQSTIDPLSRVDPVHGEETYGLGTSTFLDGAPASRTAIQRRESETRAEAVQGGLQRKKSLAQRIRGMSRREYGDDRPVIRGYENRVNGDPTSPSAPGVSERLVQSAGGPSKQRENNPFDTMYDDAFDKKGAAIRVAEQDRETETKPEFTGRARAPSSPKRNVLERRVTADSAEDYDSKSSGLLGRMKSLKGPRRGRRES